MKIDKFRNIALTKGAVHVYDFGAVRLHAYRTNDPLNNSIMLLEKDNKGVVIETPCFHRNRIELSSYIEWLGIKPEGVLTSYHITGKDFLKGVKRYGTRESENYRSGRCLSIVSGLAEIFGPDFDKSVMKITNYISGDSITIAGIRMNINRTNDAFDIEIPEINAIYVHMMGHDEHSYLPGIKAAEAELAKMSVLLGKKYDMILTSHHFPEDAGDVREKVKYLRKLLDSARVCRTADCFKGAMRCSYPGLSNWKFLEMTAKAIYG